MDAVEDRMESLTQKKSQVRVLFRPLFKGLTFWDSPFSLPSPLYRVRTRNLGVISLALEL
jgi:hypothetical protein